MHFHGIVGAILSLVHGLKPENFRLAIAQGCDLGTKGLFRYFRFNVPWRHRAEFVHGVAEISTCAPVDLDKEEAVTVEDVDFIERGFEDLAKPTVQGLNPYPRQP